MLNRVVRKRVPKHEPSNNFILKLTLFLCICILIKLEMRSPSSFEERLMICVGVLILVVGKYRNPNSTDETDASSEPAPAADLLPKPSRHEPLVPPDPLLIRAFDHYENRSVPREKVIALFEEFIRKNPFDPRVAEIYFRIATLHSTHLHEEAGDIDDQLSEIKYLALAHDRWGKAVSDMHRTAWSRLAFNSHDFAMMQDYYQWLLDASRENSSIPTFATRSLRMTLKGQAPALSPEELQQARESFNRSCDVHLQAAEKRIMWHVGRDPKLLTDLKHRFASTPLGTMAATRLAEIESA